VSIWHNPVHHSNQGAYSHFREADSPSHLNGGIGYSTRFGRRDTTSDESPFPLTIRCRTCIIQGAPPT